MDKDAKEKMKEEIWTSHNYYQLAEKASLELNHLGMKILLRLAKGAHTILDLGCGEGTRLNAISPINTKAVGIDISQTAINLAKKKYPKIKFIVGDIENSILNEQFDLVYTAYVLEHLSEPTKVLMQAIRLVKKNGFLVLIAPNYGAPNRCSPPFKGSRIKKLVIGLINDFFIAIKGANHLEWSKVKPIADSDNWDIDWDTTVEPYINSLISFLRKRGIKIIEFNSCWSEELKDARFHQLVFRFLGEMGIYPFSMWGPHLVVVAQKIRL